MTALSYVIPVSTLEEQRKDRQLRLLSVKHLTREVKASPYRALSLNVILEIMCLKR